MSANIPGIVLALYALIMWSYPITGGHINPAVTFGIYVKGYKHYLKNLPMFITILAGAFSGAFAGANIFLWIVKGPSGFKAHLYPREGVDNGQAFFIEMVCTGFFVFAICLIKFPNTSRFVSEEPMLKVGFGIVMLTMALNACGPYTGGCLNPAVGVA